MWCVANNYHSPLRYRKHFCVVPNVSWGLLPWEADMLIVSKNGYLTEVEIKVSFQDWKIDAEKKKHQQGWHGNFGRVWLRKFYYAAPMKLALRHAEVWLRPGAGIIGIDPDGRVRVIVEAQPDLRAQKLSEKEMLQVARLGTMRFWREIKFKREEPSG